MLLQPSLSSPRDLLSCFLLYQSLISFSFLILSLYLYLYLSISPSLSTFLSLAFSFSLPLSISPLRPPSALPLPSLIASLLLVSTFISASCLLLSTSSSPRLLLHFFSYISHLPLPLSFPFLFSLSPYPSSILSRPFLLHTLLKFVTVCQTLLPFYSAYSTPFLLFPHSSSFSTVASPSPTPFYPLFQSLIASGPAPAGIALCRCHSQSINLPRK